MKVKQNDEEALSHINMKHIGEYWVARAHKFWNDRYGTIPLHLRPLDKRCGAVW